MYVTLEEDIHILSMIRLVQEVELKPQNIHTCMARTTVGNGVGKGYAIELLSNG